MGNIQPKKSAGDSLSALSGIIAPLVFLLVVVVALAVIARDQQFMSRGNWKLIIQSTAVVAILAAGETAIIILGGIDLSVGRVLAFSSVVTALAMVNYHVGIPMAVLIAMTTGAACGLISGLLTTYARMPSFIATLGMMGLANGLALWASGSVNVSGMAPGFDNFAMGEFLGSSTRDGIPVPLILMLVAIGVVYVLLRCTRLGRYIYAIGGNKDAARLSGISINKTTIATFVLMGLLAGFAAVLHIARTGGAQPTSGEGMELKAIAATVIGGTSLSGGSGGVAGTLIGALLMGVIQNGCDLKGVPPHFQLIIIGGVIWLAAAYDGLRRRGTAK